MQIPGVGWVSAAVIIAKIGTDMTVFKSAAHLTSWAIEHAREGGLCPGSHKSAGKQRSGQVRKGAVHLKTTLMTAAVNAAKTWGSYLADKSRWLRARRGEMRSHVAIAHKILVAIYHMLAIGMGYRDLGQPYLDIIDQPAPPFNSRRLRNIGYDVHITPKAA